MSEWVRFPSRYASWHLLRTWTRMPGRGITLCGRIVHPVDPPREHPPEESRTCELCFRVRERAS